MQGQRGCLAFVLQGGSGKLKKIIYNLLMTVKNKQDPVSVSLELISSGEFLYLKTPPETNSRDSENGPLSNLFQA